MAYPSKDFMKHRQGDKRQPRFGEWYENKQAHKEARQYFSASEGGVPNNPTNYQSFTPIGAPVNPDGSPAGDYVFRRNPYGDGEQIVQQEGPVFSRPTQWGKYNEGSGMAPGAGMQGVGPGWGGGPGTDMSPSRIKGARGMNTGMGRLGSGPRRDEPRR